MAIFRLAQPHADNGFRAHFHTDERNARLLQPRCHRRNFILSRGKFQKTILAIRVRSHFARFRWYLNSVRSLCSSYGQAMRVRDFSPNSAAEGLRRILFRNSHL